MKFLNQKPVLFLLSISVCLLSFTLYTPTKDSEKAPPFQVLPSQSTYKPWAYWWWMGNSVSREGITENLVAYQKAGLGGLHIIPIYGEKGDEENYIDYLSPEWMNILVHTVKTADSLGLGIDMTTGTGWPFGGPEINLEHSAKSFIIKSIDLDKTQNINDIAKSMKGKKLIFLSATKDDENYENIIDSVGEKGNIQNSSGYKNAIALFMQPTRQKVKRAAPGGEGLVLDYFNRSSIEYYIKKFRTAFTNTSFSRGSVRAFYNDSYEVYGANFTAGFPEKFKDLRSYNFGDYLHIIADTTNSEIRQRIISDYSQTMAELLNEEFTRTWVDLSHQMGMITRNQAHGSPGNLLDLYATCDIPETESFGVSDFSIPGLRKDPDFEEERFGRPNPLTMKFASSAAHITGKKLVSSETATWLGDHFKVALSQVKPQIDELFTAGINHIFYHGITYNPPEKPFPGRLFYASTNFGTRSHFWNELPALNKYIENCQKILQNSQPDNDILVYFPIHDIWTEKIQDNLLLMFDVHHSDYWLKESDFGRMVASLQEMGYSFDYLSDNMLENTTFLNNDIVVQGGKYKTILVPYTKYMPENTLEKLVKLAKEGAQIIFEDKLPESVPGFYNYKKRERKFNKLKDKSLSLFSLNPDVIKELENAEIPNESMASAGLSFIRKKHKDTTIYFISNLGDIFSNGIVNLSTPCEYVEIYDPLSGKKGILPSVLKNNKTEIDLILEPGQSCILFCSNKKPNSNDWKSFQADDKFITINTLWKIKALSTIADPPKPLKTGKLVSWTEFSKKWAFYSGKSLYSCEFEIDDEFIGKEMIIDLGDVRETALIKINGENIGLLWCIPFKTVIPENILKKNNSLEIEVTNLSFNKIIDMDKKGIPWKNFHEINFVNIKYEPYDASAEKPLPSGLLSNIRLYPLKH